MSKMSKKYSYGYIPFLFGLIKVEAMRMCGNWHIVKCHRCNKRGDVIIPKNSSEWHSNNYYSKFYQNFFREKAKKTEYWQDLVVQFYKNSDEKVQQLRLL